MVQFHRIAAGIGAALVLLHLAGCGSARVAGRTAYRGSLPKPAQVLVYNFAVAPHDVDADPGFKETIHLSKQTASERSAQEIEVGRRIASLVTEKLVAKMQQAGLPARRASGTPPRDGRTYAVTGHFLSIDEGSKTERVAVGFKAGGSALRVQVRIFQLLPSGSRTVDEFEVDATGGGKPGALATGAVGLIAGANPAVMILANVGTTIASEKFSAGIEAVADDAADKITEVGRGFFQREGWIR